MRGDYKEALRAFRQGLEIEPGNPGLQKGYDDLRASLREGELPSAAATPVRSPCRPQPLPSPAAEARRGLQRSRVVREPGASDRGRRGRSHGARLTPRVIPT